MGSPELQPVEACGTGARYIYGAHRVADGGSPELMGHRSPGGHWNALVAGATRIRQ